MKNYLIAFSVVSVAVICSYAFQRPPQQRLFHFTLTEQQTSELYDIINKSSASHLEVVDVFTSIQEQVQAQVVSAMDTTRKAPDSTSSHHPKK